MQDKMSYDLTSIISTLIKYIEILEFLGIWLDNLKLNKREIDALIDQFGTLGAFNWLGNMKNKVSETSRIVKELFTKNKAKINGKISYYKFTYLYDDLFKEESNHTSSNKDPFTSHSTKLAKKFEVECKWDEVQELRNF